MLKEINDVNTFHEMFNIENGHEPTLISEKDFELRYKMIKEELDEYKEACFNGNIVEVADALADILYLTFGAICIHGLQDKAAAIFQAVQDSNMSKLGSCPDDTDGDGKCAHVHCNIIHRKPIVNDGIINKDQPVGKILKGPHYFKPNIAAIIYGEESKIQESGSLPKEGDVEQQDKSNII